MIKDQIKTHHQCRETWTKQNHCTMFGLPQLNPQFFHGKRYEKKWRKIIYLRWYICKYGQDMDRLDGLDSVKQYSLVWLLPHGAGYDGRRWHAGPAIELAEVMRCWQNHNTKFSTEALVHSQNCSDTRPGRGWSKEPHRLMSLITVYGLKVIMAAWWQTSRLRGGATTVPSLWTPPIFCYQNNVLSSWNTEINQGKGDNSPLQVSVFGVFSVSYNKIT